MDKKQDLPAMPFYVGDWFKSPEVRALTLPTRMIWFEMLCFMWQSSDRGKLSINGRPIITLDSNFVITKGGQVLAQMLSISLEQLQSAIHELADFAVFSIDEEGVIYSRFMLKIVEIQQKRSISGKKGMESRYGCYNKNLTNDITNDITNTEIEYENENNKITKSKREKKDPFPEIPDSLKSIPEFPETWESFLTNRKQMKHPVTGEAAKQLFRKLATLIDPVSELTRSIEKNWQGLFPNFDNIKPAYELSRDLHRLLIHIHQTTTALRTLKPLTPERADAFMKLYPEKIIPEKIAEIEQALMKKEITGKTMEEAIKNWRAK